MNNWELVTEDDFNEFEIDTAYIASDYDFESNVAPTREQIVCVTTGDISISTTKTFANYGDDVNGINGRFAELEYVESSETTLSFTSLNTDAETIALGLGGAIVDGEKITPDDDLKEEYFREISVIARKKGGGLVGAKIKRALSTGGLTLTTSKNAKGNIPITMTAYKTINNPNEAVVEYYSTASIED